MRVRAKHGVHGVTMFVRTCSLPSLGTSLVYTVCLSPASTGIRPRSSMVYSPRTVVNCSRPALHTMIAVYASFCGF